MAPLVGDFVAGDPEADGANLVPLLAVFDAWDPEAEGAKLAPLLGVLDNWGGSESRGANLVPLLAASDVWGPEAEGPDWPLCSLSPMSGDPEAEEIRTHFGVLQVRGWHSSGRLVQPNLVDEWRWRLERPSSPSKGMALVRKIGPAQSC